ncbi:TPA: hypothetical protein N0F65_011249 [Lagenidium giganteum]|uniref:Uncharacterized protein n=1 Tax=Lagenidium giganteum TaxID=4803 RepID=A0AAV2YZX2_9STRA|nr:TPA: hypothetical protein N0F65_011249 [Lagenidium giganteum]
MAKSCVLPLGSTKVSCTVPTPQMLACASLATVSVPWLALCSCANLVLSLQM